jgi:hypothetical protein
MSMTNAAEANLLNLLFLNVDWADVGDASGLQNSATSGSFYISLHTADPGESGNQTTSETSYTSYTRIAVARTGSGFTLTGQTITNAALIQFPQCTGGSSIITHFGIGTDSSGPGNLILKGSLASSLSVSNGIQPQFASSALSVTVD